MNKSQDQTTIEEVLAAERERCRANNARDWNKLEEIFGNDLTHTHASGKVETKAEQIAALQKKPRTTESTGLKVRAYGDVAITNGKHITHLQPRPDGSPRLSIMEVTQVWVKRDGRWQLVARQGARVSED